VANVCALLAVVLRRVVQRFDVSLYVFFCVGCSECTETLLQPRVQTFWSATQQFSCDRVEKLLKMFWMPDSSAP